MKGPVIVICRLVHVTHGAVVIHSHRRTLEHLHLSQTPEQEEGPGFDPQPGVPPECLYKRLRFTDSLSFCQ